MPFPERKRIIYNKNPLDQVICQLRFPPILRIDAEIPARFQELIRRNFPNYSENTDVAIEIPAELRAQIPQEFLGQAIQSAGKNYEFATEDNLWKANLTRTFLALSAKKYTRWEEFKEKIQSPLHALVEVYAPDSISRIGLRYVDIIKRSSLDLKDVEWKDLLQPHFLGLLGSPEVGTSIINFENVYEIKLTDNESTVRIITRFVKAKDAEICFMIDSDFFNQKKMTLESAIQKLDFFNVRGSRLIQWCITDRLHEAMEPVEIS